MKPIAIYIPQLGKTFFIEEIISISDITLFKPSYYDFTAAYFEIQFKNKKKIKIKNFKWHEGDENDFCEEKFNFSVITDIRNEFLKYINIVNAQTTDKEQPKFLVMEDNYPISFVVNKKDYKRDGGNVEFIPIKTGEIG